MPQVLEAQLSAASLKVAVVVSRFNSLITERLLAGALDAFIRHGGDEELLTIIKVPGAFELPLVCQATAQYRIYDALVALGAVIRGSTPHFDYVAAEVSKGLAQVQLATMVPISFGVLTCDTVEQAVDRAGTKSGNKGFDAMVSAIEMAQLMRKLPGGSDSPEAMTPGEA
ncbi:MAG: 6,7-dimethyl-8-ribityllumazine synthase [Deltaproteobacteria bacterium]|jgi:6,7-dimethyl-8-ribityllumazine synthase|nr:6,7-dimethyl-8-ribityllumazine synthase [Deltaproteobacteria bacterium]